MHKLDRIYPEPEALLNARKTGLSWDTFPTADKEEVQLLLTVMQDNRCAYCECALKMGEGHIEHFRKKNNAWFPELTFEWTNLFYSCMRSGSCGVHKDKGDVLRREQVDLLLNPCVDNPEDFLIFTSDGDVSPRPGLTDADRKRAELTIEVFNLRHPQLLHERANEIRKYQWLIDRQVSQEEVDDVLSSSRIDQYITAVYHFLGKKVV